MSSTAVKGIDVAICEIKGAPPNLRAEVLSSLTIPWPIDLRNMVLEAGRIGKMDIADLCLLDAAVGETYAGAAIEGISHAGYYPEQIDLIGLQGYTVRHEVRQDGHVMASLQIGEAAVVAEWTGITTVSSFRQRDIAAGGQGAPLVGYVDWLLFRHPYRNRAVVRIDQMTSVTLLPPLALAGSEPQAFDVGPGTILIEYAEAHQGVQSGDVLVQCPASVDQALLDKLMGHPFVRRVPPKAVGQDAFGESFAENMWHEAVQSGLQSEQILETLVAFTTGTIKDALGRSAAGQLDEIIVGGAGRRYPYLMKQLREAMAPAHILAHEDVGFDSDSKDALGVAVLAYEAAHNRPGTLPSLTGVHRPTTLGCITPGRNFENLRLITHAS